MVRTTPLSKYDRCVEEWPSRVYRFVAELRNAPPREAEKDEDTVAQEEPGSKLKAE